MPAKKMTREEILELSGQPLVEAVATHPEIMGWEKYSKDIEGQRWWITKSSGPYQSALQLRDALLYGGDCGGNVRPQCLVNEWNPLTDENHLAEVRERMIERGWEKDDWTGLEGVAITFVLTSDKTKHGSASSPNHKDYATTLLRAARLAVSEEA